MSRKNKGKAEDKANKEDENDKHCRKIICVFNIFKTMMWWCRALSSITIASLAVLAVYYGVKYGTMSEQLPRLDMNKYWGAYPMNPIQDMSIRPYKIEFSDVMINDLRERLLHQRPFQNPLEDSGSSYGFNSLYLTKVLNYWKNEYDFKGREKFFNKYKHFVTNIQGLDIHYMHVKPAVSPDSKVVTLLLLHSWPGSIREFYGLIPRLIIPNDEYKFVFEIIAPSLPGFGFSQAPARPGMDPTEMAIIISNLMARIGRKRYFIHGGDIGHSVGSALATISPNNVFGFHTSTPKIYHPLTIFHTVFAILCPKLVSKSEFPNQPYSPKNMLWRLIDETGYLHIQATKPDTIGISLTDSPSGLAAYIMEKFSILTNPENQKAEDGNLRNKFSLTQLLDNVMVYWATNSISTSMRIHAEHYRTKFNMDLVATDVPTWGMKFRHSLTFAPSVALRKKYKNYLHTTVVDDGGNFAAMEHPALLANDIFEAVEAFIDFHAQNKSIKKKQQVTTSKASNDPETIYDFTVTDINGNDIKLDKYKGYVLLIVNVASQCGLTDKNYQQLTELYKEYEGKGLRILAFPCNQFGYQEPGNLQEIAHFTKSRGVQFDVFSKIEVNGENAHPLWQFLKRIQSGTFGDWIKWNFSKFIVDRNGFPVERFGPDVDPFDLKPYIDKYINLTDDDVHQDL